MKAAPSAFALLQRAFGMVRPAGAASDSQADWSELDGEPLPDESSNGPHVLEAECRNTVDAAAHLGVHPKVLRDVRCRYRKLIRHGFDEKGRLWWLAADVARVAEARRGDAR